MTAEIAIAAAAADTTANVSQMRNASGLAAVRRDPLPFMPKA